MKLSSKKRDALIEWIAESLEKGQSTGSVKDALLSLGLSITDIINLVYYLSEQYFYPMRDALIHDKDTPDESIKLEIRHLLKAGLNKSQILLETSNSGYTKRAVERAYASVSLKDKLGLFIGSTIVLISYGALFAFLLYVSLVRNNNPSVIIVGFFPSIINLAVVIIFIERFHSKYSKFLWLVPLLLCGAFYIIASTVSHPVFNVMDVAGYTATNLIFSLTIVSVLFIIGAMGKETNKIIDSLTSKHYVSRQKVKKHSSLREKTESQISELAGYSQYLNNCISEVYSKANNASNDLRKKLMINMGLFDHIRKEICNDPQRNPQKFTDDLMHIKDSYRNLTKREYEIIKENLNKLEINCRKNDGSDRIIDVIDSNTKKAAMQAFNESLMILQDLFMEYKKLLHFQEAYKNERPYA